MQITNWFMVVFCGGIVLSALIGMPVMMICDHIKAKRREKRNRRPIEYWWEMRVDK